MKKRYPLLIASLVLGVLIVILGQVSANFNHGQRNIPGREMGLYNYQIEMKTEFFTLVDELEMENGYLSSTELTVSDVVNENEYRKVKGIFITGWVAGLEGKMDEFIELARQTEINAFVIDVKDDTGMMSYNSSVPLVSEVKANLRKIKNIQHLIQRLKEEDIYLIGRVVAFKDPVMAKAMPDRALQLVNSENVWIDDVWISPYQKENWEYNVAIAREALELGFDEIQFDYVRFPAYGNGPTQVFDEGEISKEEVINSFLSYARKELAPLGAPISADIFGAVTSVNNDLGIGQKLETISNTVDIISPMIYPSHYAHGVFKLPIPEAAPYETIYHSMNDAITRLTKDHPVRLRPWLQDFSLKFTYGVEEVRQQIKALEDLGIDEWLLWNPRSRYTKAALLPKNDDYIIAEGEEEEKLNSVLDEALTMDDKANNESNVQ